MAWLLRGIALWRQATRRSKARHLRAMAEWLTLWWALLAHRALLDEPLLRRLAWALVRGVRRIP